ncbi:MAG: phosphatase PAP2 family protein [Bacteroidales bacterium]|nr:phosphatase PAP2 family protein [Bacteroidales bacterium]MBD5235014.1 phosphatase PAP2 family protein [Barnesiella sp.]MBD5257578.1 phosphatase PAP2 family protein [Barnesiella sp.]
MSKAVDTVVKTIAGIISIVSSPLLMPTYAMAISLWCTYLVFAPAGARWQILMLTFAITTMIPVMVLFVLTKVKVIKHPSLNERTDRPYIYAAAAMSYMAIALYLAKINSPAWLSMFMLSAGATAIVTMVVNFKWKISGHATCIGGLTALTFFLSYRSMILSDNDSLFIISIIASGAVMTSRLILDRHTLAQVVAGFFNGVLWVSVFQLLAA